MTAILAWFAGNAAISFVARYWKPILIGAAAIGLAATIWIQHVRLENRAERIQTLELELLSTAEQLKFLRLSFDAQKKALEGALVDKQRAREEANDLKKGLDDAKPESNGLVAPGLDDLLDRLRQLDGPADHAG